jgi:hypothetical protein
MGARGTIVYPVGMGTTPLGMVPALALTSLMAAAGMILRLAA